tara:strand:- start:4636 stop:5838 length:1203 start_codon:yes stop_codon:yes gene_type:complete
MKVDATIKIILEPISRNTAPSLTLAALACPDSYLIVMPSDHYLKNDQPFIRNVKKSIECIKESSIFTFGVKPNSISSSYGHIIYKGNKDVKKIVDFIEKPKISHAKRLCKEGKCFWNVGVFILNSKTWIDAIRETNKSIYNNTYRSWQNKTIDNIFIRPRKLDYKKSISRSIDYAVMENAVSIGLDIRVIELKTQWSDIGQHVALECLFKANKRRNILSGNIVEHNTKNTTVLAKNRNISLLGVEDLIIIDTKDALLVINKNKPSSMKELLDKVNKTDKNILVEHSTVHRPWGVYEVMSHEKNSKIKRIIVKPHAELSYQSHKHRNEHWIVVEGTATIKKNEKEFSISKNESTYIKSGDKHKLMNKGKNDLVIIEVQTGKKLTEEDIIRYDDIYGRVSDK